MVARIKKNDTVSILTGKDKNKQGTVLEILSDKNKVLVKNIAIVTRHTKARKQGDVAEIRKQESYINLSNVMLICNACRKPSRVNSSLLETGKRIRVCNRCEQIV